MSKTEQALSDQMQIIKALGWGELDLTLRVHEGEVANIIIYGKKKNIYNRSSVDSRDNNLAYREIAERITQAVKSGEKATLKFEVEVASQRIKSTTWVTKTVKPY
jgi:hypothetical protein